MRCCVPFCRNTEHTVSDSTITFHGFPIDPHLRTAWLKALDIRRSHLPGSAVVCSSHFLNDDLYETNDGLKQVRTGVIPTTVQLCRLCLDTDSDAFLISKYELETAYEKLTGLSLCDIGNLKQTLCTECAHRLINFSRFKDNCLTAHSVMMDLVKRHDLITIQHKKIINRNRNKLKSNLENIALQKYTDEEQRTDLYETIKINESNSTKEFLTEIKIERNENNDSDNMNVPVEYNEPHIEIDSIKLERDVLDDIPLCEAPSKPSDSKGNEIEMDESLKCESITLECTDCFKTFTDENAYNGHVMRHVKKYGQTDFDVCETQRRPTSATYILDPDIPSTSGHSSLVDNRSDQDLSHESPENNPSKSVAPLLTRLFTYKGKQVYSPAETNEVDKNKKASQIVNDLYHIPHATMINNPGIYGDFISKKDKSLTETRKFIGCRSSELNNSIFCEDRNYQRANRNEIYPTEVLEAVTEREKVNKFNICRHKFKDNFFLARHTRSHTNEKSFSCNLCDYKCALSSNLVSHMSTHMEAKQTSYDSCDYECPLNSNLVRHVNTDTGAKPFSCNLCEFRSAQKTGLLRHVRIHSGEKPFSCNLCEYKSAQRSALATHMRTHTGVKPFSCNLCKYKSTQKISLVRHMRTHTGSKPFSCNLCGYKSADKNGLVDHVRTHTGAKPFCCNLCEYKSAQRSALATHMRTHTGEKPFSCNVCEYKSTQKSSLVRHMRTHT